MHTLKNALCAGAGVVFSAMAQMFGGWDAALGTLIAFMAVDYVTGFLAAAVFHKSRKTEDGRLQATGMVARNAEQRSAEEQAFLNGQPKMIAPRMSDAAKRMKEHAAQMVSPLYKDQQGRRSATSIWPRINYEKFKGLVVLVNWNDCEFSLGEGAQDFYQKLSVNTT